MGFCLDNSKFSYHISLEIQKKIKSSKSNVPLKISLLFLISDILSNSSRISGCSSFKVHLQSFLISIFESLRVTFSTISGRVSSSQFMDRVTRVLKVWDHWNIFPLEFINTLKEKSGFF